MSIKENTPAANSAATVALAATDFFIVTSPEMDALQRATADGKNGRNYDNNPYEESRYHQVPGSSHSVCLELTDAEKMMGGGKEMLESLTGAQDADGTLALLYISHLLAPPSPLEPNAAAAGKVEFDDVLFKIGWRPHTTTERREMHKRLYNFIRFCERAQVKGTRRGKYTDKHTGQVIPTEIRSSLWRVTDTEKPTASSNYTDPDTPVAVELVMSREWSRLLTSAQTAQYLPMGEVLGAILGNKPSGAWARVIGLALASFWRRLPHETLSGSIKPTRRELLERYPPKTGTVKELLESKNSQRAMVYWCGALQLLVEAGFIANEGEALITAEEMRANYPRKGWDLAWLNEKVEIYPAEFIHDSISQRATAKPAIPHKRRGRPSKKTG